MTTIYLEQNHPDVKIILTGNGGDELFYGYQHLSYKVEEINKHINTLFGYCTFDTTNETLKISEFKTIFQKLLKYT